MHSDQHLPVCVHVKKSFPWIWTELFSTFTANLLLSHSTPARRRMNNGLFRKPAMQNKKLTSRAETEGLHLKVKLFCGNKRKHSQKPVIKPWCTVVKYQERGGYNAKNTSGATNAGSCRTKTANFVSYVPKAKEARIGEQIVTVMPWSMSVFTFLLHENN